MKNNRHRMICYLLIFVILLSLLATNVLSSESDENRFYGYVINVYSDQLFSQQTNITILVNELLHENVPVYWITKDIEVTTSSLNSISTSIKRSFNKGSFLITFDSTPSTDIRAISIINNYFLNYDVEAYRLNDKLENLDVIELVEPKIAHYAGKAVYTTHKYILADGGFQNQKELTPEQVLDELTNEYYNVLIWGGGDSSAIVEIRQDIVSIRGLQVRKKIRSFVANGGGYTGSCYGGWRASSGIKRPLGIPQYLGTSQLLNLLPMQLDLLNVNVYRALPGSGDVDLKITNTDHPLTYGLPDIIHNHSYVGGPMFIEKKFFKSNVETIGIIEDVSLDDWDWDDYMTLCPWWSSTFVSEETKMKIARDWMDQDIGKPIWVTGKFGEGKVVAFGGHPEYASSGDWNMGYDEMPRTVYNSIFYACSKDKSQISLDKSYSFSKLDVDAGGPYIGLMDENIQFSGNVENGTPPFEWMWQFEMPSRWYVEDHSVNLSLYEQNPKYAYYRSGDYKATLIVTDADGNVGSDTAEIDVSYSYRPPLIELSLDHYESFIGEGISFNCNVKYGIPPYDYHWYFGNGEESNEKNPVHSYDEEGEFEVSLEVKDSWGTKVTESENVFITENLDTTEKSSTSSNNILIIVALIIALIVIALVVIFIVRKKQF